MKSTLAVCTKAKLTESDSAQGDGGPMKDAYRNARNSLLTEYTTKQSKNEENSQKIHSCDEHKRIDFADSPPCFKRCGKYNGEGPDRFGTYAWEIDQELLTERSRGAYREPLVDARRELTLAPNVALSNEAATRRPSRFGVWRGAGLYASLRDMLLVSRRLPANGLGCRRTLASVTRLSAFFVD